MVRLIKQFSKNKRCYYCGAPPPSSREHAPVEVMFEAFDCDSITVPSCDKHNTEKNLDDRAIVELLIKGLFIKFRYGSLTQNTLKAIEAAYPKLGNANEVSLRSWVKDPRGELDTHLSYLDKQVDINKWMIKLTAALVWSVIGDFDEAIEWDNAIAWSPEFVKGDDALGIEQAGLKLQKFRKLKTEITSLGAKWWSGWSAYPRSYPPDIYHFEISFLPSQYFLEDSSELEIIFRHRFYSTFSWYVWFTASKATKQSIMSIVRK